MISCVICSRTPKISDELEKNIAETIGCEYELVVIDNSKNEYSIFSAYNEGVKRSCGGVLCFMHDDILYRDRNWGGRVEKIFENEKIGCVGVLGGHYVPKETSAWWYGQVKSARNLQWDYKKEPILCEELVFAKEKKEMEVAVVDGLWICIPKRMFEQIRWDEETYGKCFHLYDSDICMQIQNIGKQVWVVLDCLIEHKSCGSANAAFYTAMEKFCEKWKDSLPILRGIQTIDSEQLMEILNLYSRQSLIYIERYAKTLKRYESVLNSNAFKLGNVLLRPIYKLKNLMR